MSDRIDAPLPQSPQPQPGAAGLQSRPQSEAGLQSQPQAGPAVATLGAPGAEDGRPPSARAIHLDAPVRHITFREAMDSESAKIRSVRSTFWTLLISLLLSVGISVLIAAVTSANWDTISLTQRAGTDMSTVVAGVYFGVLVTGVLGVLVVSSEYSTGMMRTSLTAFPRRGTLFAAKTVVLVIVVLIVGLIIAFASYLLASPFYTRHGVDLSLGHTANLRALLAVPVYLALVSLMGLGLGYLLRHTAAAISSLVGLMFVIPIITNFLPGTVGRNIDKIVPSNAGSAMMITHSTLNGTQPLSPLGGLIAMLVWTAVFLVPAVLLFRRRDA